jgi:hypothetical protein
MPDLTPACAYEAMANMAWTLLPHLAHSPDLAPSNYHLFGPVKDALHVCHFADDNTLKQSLHDVLWSQGRKFYITGIHSLIQWWLMCTENDGDWKNSLTITKHVWIINVNFIVIAITYSDKKTGSITFIPALVYFTPFTKYNKHSVDIHLHKPKFH